MDSFRNLEILFLIIVHLHQLMDMQRIVYEVSGNTYKIAEQWNGSNTVKSNTKTVATGQYGVSYTIIGVARPKKSNNYLK